MTDSRSVSHLQVIRIRQTPSGLIDLEHLEDELQVGLSPFGLIMDVSDFVVTFPVLLSEMCTHQPTADRLCVCLRYFSPTHHWLSGPVLHVSNTPLGHNGHTTIAGWDGSLDLTDKPGAVG